MIITCVCGNCGHHANEEASIELNFREHKIYFVCPKCKKQDQIEMQPSLAAQPFPRIGRMK